MEKGENFKVKFPERFRTVQNGGGKAFSMTVKALKYKGERRRTCKNGVEFHCKKAAKTGKKQSDKTSKM